MKHYQSSRVLCPCYRHEDKRRQVISCDAPVNGAITHLAFANYKEWRQYHDAYCNDDYKQCAIYKMLERET